MVTGNNGPRLGEKALTNCAKAREWPRRSGKVPAEVEAGDEHCF
jgi:hypothetical protein